MSTSTNKEAILPIMRGAFRTTTSAPTGRYTMHFVFESMAEMHAADDEWRKFATVAASPSVQGESIDSERAAFEAEEIAHWQQAQSHPLTDEEKKFLLRPANSLSSGDYYACEDRWIGWKRRARLARTAAPSELTKMQPLETVQYWAAEFAKDPQKLAGGMIVQLLKEYAELRTSMAAAPSEGLAIPTWREQRDAAGSGYGNNDCYMMTEIAALRAALARAPATEQAKPSQEAAMQALADQAQELGMCGGLTDAMCTEILTKAMCEVDTWADSQPVEPTKDQVAGRTVRAILAAQPVPQASGERDAEFDEAAKFIDAQAEQYLRDNASVEHDTGAVVFHYGEAGRDHHSTLVELADDLRSFKSAATTSKPTGSQG